MKVREKIRSITLALVIFTGFLLIPIEGLQNAYRKVLAYGTINYPTFLEDFNDPSLLGWWWYKKQRPEYVNIVDSAINFYIPAYSAPFSNVLCTKMKFRLGVLEWYGKIDMDNQHGGWATTTYAVFLYEDDTREEVDFEFVPYYKNKVFLTVWKEGKQYSTLAIVNNISQPHLYKVVVTSTLTAFYIDGQLAATAPGLSFSHKGAYIILGAYSKQNETNSGFMSIEWVKYMESS